MAEYHHRGHSVCDLKYHLIWVTKYRFAVLKGDVAIRCRDLIREICQAREVSVVRGAVSPDPVHLLVSAPPILAPAKLAQYLKGSGSRRLQEEFPSFAKAVLGPASVGAWVLLRDGRGSGRENHQTLPRRTEVGRRRRRAVSHCHGQVGGRRAFKRLRAAPWTFSPTPSHQL